jgi:hypothetical protein
VSRNVNAERPGGFHIDRELKFDRLFDGSYFPHVEGAISDNFGGALI